MSRFRSRRNYWSHSWLSRVFLPERNDIPEMGMTREDWIEWESKMKENHPIRYWISDVLLDKIQDIVLYPVDLFHEVRYHIKNRYRHSHCLCSTLEKGQYHDFRELLLYASFDSLVEFVEIEKASMCHNGEEDGRFKRSREKGMECLEWESNLEFPEEQAEVAKKIIDLYTWWKDVRPYREDPYEVLEWGEGIFDMKFKYSIEEITRLEDEYDQEDQEKLKQLVDIRLGLWT